MPVNGKISGDPVIDDATGAVMAGVKGGANVGVPASLFISGTQLDLKVDKVLGKQLSTEDYSTAEKEKLADIAANATANDTDANLKNRANHTGTQLSSTISDFNAAADARADTRADARIAAATGVSIQAFSTHLSALAAASKTDGGFIVTDGTTYVVETGATARASMGAMGTAFEGATGTIPNANLPERLMAQSAVGTAWISDWNGISGSGWYSGPFAANSPDGSGEWFVGEAVMQGPDWGFVKAYLMVYAGAANTYTWGRYKAAGTWGAWFRLRASEAELDARYILSGSGTIPEERLPVRLQTLSYDASITDWNNVTASGFYAQYAAANAPDASGAWFYGTVVAQSHNWLVQVLTKMGYDTEGDTQTWRRIRSDGTWLTWHRVRFTQTELDARYALAGAGVYKGTWNANTNSPTITSSVGTLADFYIVATAGTTSIDGVASWAVGDTIKFNGTVWQKIASSAAVSSVAGKTGAVTLVNTDISGFGTASTYNIGTSGATVPLLNAENTFGTTQNITTSGTATLRLNKADGTSGLYNTIAGRTGSSLRWQANLGNEDVEAGSNSGSNFTLKAFSDAAALIGTPLSIARATGAVTLPIGGLAVGAPTGGALGIGTVNAAAYYVNGVALGTTTLKNTGTSGNTVPLLDGTNTWSGVQTFQGGAVVGDASGDPVTIKGTILSTFFAALMNSTTGLAVRTAIDAAPKVYLDLVDFGGVADGADTLEPGAKTTVRGDWVTARAYAVHDLVWVGAIGSRLGYRCLVAHTSGTFATDLAAVKWVLGAFSGTDNTVAFQAMVTAHEATGIPMRVGPGTFRMLNPSSTADSAYISLAGQTFDLKLDGTLLIDEDGTAGKNYNLFKSTNVGAATAYDQRKLLRVVGSGCIRGRWSHKPGGNTPNARAHVFYCAGYDRVVLEGWTFEDIAGSFSRMHSMNGAYVNNMLGRRVAKGGLRFINTNDACITNNRLHHFGDDTIDLHANDVFGKVRTRQYVAGNHIFDGETLICAGAQQISVIGNHMELKGAGIYIGGRLSAEGDNVSYQIVVNGNTVTDPLIPSSDGSTLGTASSLAGCIDVGSMQASWIAGDYGGSSVNDPLSGTYYQNIGLDTANLPQGGSIEICNNPIKNTRRNVSKYSDYGLGLLFHQDGWIDPAVAWTNRPVNANVLRSDVSNVKMDVNVSGFRTGAAVFFRFMSSTEAARNFAYRNVRVSGVVEDCKLGANHSFSAGSAQSILTEIHFRDFHCDLDKYHTNAGRTSGTAGTWNSGSTAADRAYGLLLNSFRGHTVMGCTFKNCYAPVVGDASFVNGVYRDIVLYGNRVAFGFNSSNKGIGDFPNNANFTTVSVTSIPSAGSGVFDKFVAVL